MKSKNIATISSITGLLIVLITSFVIDWINQVLQSRAQVSYAQEAMIINLAFIVINLLFVASLVGLFTYIILYSHGIQIVSWVFITIGVIFVFYPLFLPFPLKYILSPGTLFIPNSYHYIAEVFILVTGIANYFVGKKSNNNFIAK
jgi:hypothetical protein